MAGKTGWAKWRPMPFIALGVSMIIVDATIVNVAIPSMIEDIGLTTTDAEWVVSIYSLVFASLLLLTGRLGDIFGRRRLFLLGTVIFVLASLMAAAASGPPMLIVARLIQGLGGAMVLPCSLSTVNAIYTGRDRGVAFGIWGSVIGGTAALGPLLGGWLTTNLSWRWAFLINIPLGLIVIYGLLRAVPETRDPHARRGIDLPGTVLSILGLGSLVFGLIEGQTYGWWKPTKQFTIGGFAWPEGFISPSATALILSAILLTAFVVVERARAAAGKNVLLDFSLFNISSFRYGNVAAAIVSLGEFGLLFALPLFLQSVLGFSAWDTGVLLLALAGGAFFGGPAAAQLSRRIGARGVVRLGMLLEVIGIVGIGVVVSLTVPTWQLVICLLIYGVGVGFATAQLTGVVLEDVPVVKSGQGSAVQSTSRQLGAALGTAILGATLVGFLGSVTADRLEADGVPAAEAAKIADSVKTAPSAVIPQLEANPQTAAAAAAASEAFVDATRAVAWVAGAFVGLGLLSTLLLPPTGARPADE